MNTILIVMASIISTCGSGAKAMLVCPIGTSDGHRARRTGAVTMKIWRAREPGMVTVICAMAAIS